jgi:hypothetical protein
VVAAGAAALRRVRATVCGQPVEGGVVIETARDEAEALGEAAPDLLAEGRAGMLALTESWTIWPKSWSAQSRRAKPTSAKPGGSSPRLARS